MADHKNVHIFKGYNFRVLTVKGFDPVCFGCPPGIVKDFGKRGESLPSHYVLPIRTFVRGKNHFDFEFIIYTFLFARPSSDKITVYCTADQRERFISILQETLFGPTFSQMLQAQFRGFSRGAGFSPAEEKRFEAFLEGMASHQKLAGTFNRLLKNDVPDREIKSEIKVFLEPVIRRKKWLSVRVNARVLSQFAQNYLLCAQIKKEMDLFSLTEEKNQRDFIQRLVQFRLFGKDNSVTINSPVKKNRKLKLVQTQPAEFDLYLSNRRVYSLSVAELDRPSRPKAITPIEKPFMGVTYLGVGSGFSYNRRNSSLIVWSEGKGIMVDAFSDNSETLLSHGISENDIHFIILTHVHSDHDSGLIEKLLSGQRIRLITTRIIFESFLRKVQAISRFPQEVLEEFVDFLEVAPGKKIKLPGFKNTWLEFDYSLHSIPTARFRLTCQAPGGRKKTISHSGDTKYDEELTDRWWEMGKFSRNRRSRVLGFIWDADLIIQEVGGGNLHTELSSLTHLDTALAKKVVLVHQHKEPFNHPFFRFAREGETHVLIKRKEDRARTPFRLLSAMTLFQGVKKSQITRILKGARVRKFKSGRTVFSKNEVGKAWYVILEGFAEISLNKNHSVIYEQGMFFGELALSTSNPRRRATVKAASDLTVLKIPKKLYLQSNLPGIIDDFYRLGNYFNDTIRPGLVASLGYGSLRQYGKNAQLKPDEFTGDSVMVIISGRVKISPRGTKNVAFLSSGDIMGQIPDWEHVPLTAGATVVTDQVLVVAISLSELKRLFRLYPSFYGTVYQKLKRLESALC